MRGYFSTQDRLVRCGRLETPVGLLLFICLVLLLFNSSATYTVAAYGSEEQNETAATADGETAPTDTGYETAPTDTNEVTDSDQSGSPRSHSKSCSENSGNKEKSCKTFPGSTQSDTPHGDKDNGETEDIYLDFFSDPQEGAEDTPDPDHVNTHEQSGKDIEVPEAPEKPIITRKIAEIICSEYMNPALVAGSKTNGHFLETPITCSVKLTAEGEPDVYIVEDLFFNDEAVDYNTQGRYYISPILPLRPPFETAELTAGAKSAMLPVKIYEEGIPFFSGAGRGFLSDDYYIMHLYQGPTEDLTLWRKDKQEDEWHVFWKHGDKSHPAFGIYQEHNQLIFSISDKAVLRNPAWFAYEAKGNKGSFVFYVDLDSMDSVGIRGDRDGGDRFLLGWELFRSNKKSDDEIATDTTNTGARGSVGWINHGQEVFPDSENINIIYDLDAPAASYTTSSAPFRSRNRPRTGDLIMEPGTPLLRTEYAVKQSKSVVADRRQMTPGNNDLLIPPELQGMPFAAKAGSFPFIPVAAVGVLSVVSGTGIVISLRKKKV